jgi:DNA replication licensing factor MCM4
MSSLRTPRSGARGTPMHQRPDVRSDRKVRQVNLGANEVLIFEYAVIICMC